MTKEEIVKHLELHFAEEITASNNYLNMAEKLENKKPEYAKCLYEMAVDEHDHADFIYNCMTDYCAEPSAELMEKWKELEERFLNNC